MSIPSSFDVRDERRRPMPGDGIVPYPMAMHTRGISIHAPLANVWPWIVQIGSGRAGWYSYDWIDNGSHLSATAILPEQQRLAPGDIVPAVPGNTDAFQVAAVEPPCRLLLTVPDAAGGSQVSYEFLLSPLAQDQTRLTVRGRISTSWPTATRPAMESERPPIFIERIYGILGRIPKPVKLGVAFLGHHLMESRMLRGIRRRAEAN